MNGISAKNSLGGAVVIYENDFDKLLSEVVEDVLTDLLGENVRQVIYDHLERGFSIPKDQIPARLDDFGYALQKTFGKSHRTVVKNIVKRLYTRLELPFVEKSDYGFVEYVKEAKMNFST